MVANKLYFAYGSNMSQARIESRVGPVIKVGVHILNRWKLVFNCGCLDHRFANIVMGKYNPVECVQGVMYSLTPKQMRTLDIHEGYPDYYQKAVFPITLGGKKQVFYVYICFNPHYVPYPKTKPTKEYIDHILTGCIENDLNQALWQLGLMKRKGELVF